jgi:glutathione synthase
MEEAGRRGHRCSIAYLPDLYLRNGDGRVRARPIAVDPGADPSSRLGGREDRPIPEFDLVLMRKDPPIDTEYFHALTLLERVRDRVPIINDPAGLRKSNEKLLPLEIPGAAAPSVVTADPEVISAFVREHEEVVVKPLNDFSGHGIERLSIRDSQLDAEAVGALAAQRGRHVLVQRFLPQVVEGDKRVFVLAGEPIGWLNRIPRPGSFRANIHQGAEIQPTSLTDHERQLIAASGEVLSSRGLEFAGFDFIGEYLTEINVSSPSAVRQINQVMETRLEVPLVDYLENRVTGN